MRDPPRISGYLCGCLVRFALTVVSPSRATPSAFLTFLNHPNFVIAAMQLSQQEAV
jgi:hypothetical protein